MSDPRLLDAKSVGLYLPMETEPSIDEVVEFLFDRGVTVCVPVLRGDDLIMTSIDADTQWGINSYGIAEPISGEVIADADVYIVPMVAYHGKDRLGHGKGYFDRYLADKKGYRIGVAYACQRADFDVQAHDVPMDKVITEEEICE